jgi:hypothetical protein
MLDACLMVHGSWLEAHGSWLMAKGGRPGPGAQGRAGIRPDPGGGVVRSVLPNPHPPPPQMTDLISMNEKMVSRQGHHWRLPRLLQLRVQTRKPILKARIMDMRHVPLIPATM